MADLVISHLGAGFFSCCSVQLSKIIQYHNQYKRSPTSVDRSQTLDWYKPEGIDDVTEEYFERSATAPRYREWIHFEHYYQFVFYKTLNIQSLQPFIKTYFAPSKQIREIVANLEQKYNIDYEKTYTLFYRGNDKITEFPVGSYDDFIARAKVIHAAHPDWRCLVQTDETEFLERALQEIPNSFCFRDEIRHIPRTSETTVDKVFRESNFKFSKNFFAITLIMARVAHVICGTGNCSLWIAIYRGSVKNLDQLLDKRWELSS